MHSTRSSMFAWASCLSRFHVMIALILPTCNWLECPAFFGKSASSQDTVSPTNWARAHHLVPSTSNRDGTSDCGPAPMHLKHGLRADWSRHRGPHPHSRSHRLVRGALAEARQKACRCRIFHHSIIHGLLAPPVVFKHHCHALDGCGSAECSMSTVWANVRKQQIRDGCEALTRLRR